MQNQRRLPVLNLFLGSILAAAVIYLLIIRPRPAVREETPPPASEVAALPDSGEPSAPSKESRLKAEELAGKIAVEEYLSRKSEEEDISIAACLRSFSARKIVGKCRTEKLRFDKKLAADLENYFVCLAHAKRKKSVCDSLKVVKKGEKSFAEPCRARYVANIALSDFLLEGRNDRAICRVFWPAGRRPKDEERACGLIFESILYGSPVCPELVSEGLFPKSKKGISECIKEHRYLEGKPGVCRAFKDEARRKLCEERAVLVRALRAGDAKKCGAFPMCSAIVGRDLKACKIYERKAAMTFCTGNPPWPIAPEMLEWMSAEIKKDILTKDRRLRRMWDDMLEERERQKARSPAEWGCFVPE